VAAAPLGKLGMATLAVNTNTDVVDAGDGKLSLREALAQAHAGDTIAFGAARRLRRERHGRDRRQQRSRLFGQRYSRFRRAGRGRIRGLHQQCKVAMQTPSLRAAFAMRGTSSFATSRSPGSPPPAASATTTIWPAAARTTCVEPHDYAALCDLDLVELGLQQFRNRQLHQPA
jgi:hypothetical protein